MSTFAVCTKDDRIIIEPERRTALSIARAALQQGLNPTVYHLSVGFTVADTEEDKHGKPVLKVYEVTT